MAKAANKTTATANDVERFVQSVAHEGRREDCRTAMQMLTEISGEPPTMWGSSIIGFGTYHYVYESGREGDMFLTGVSPRKQSLTVYVMDGFEPHAALLEKLGKHKKGKSCLYINKLDDVDVKVLKRIVRDSVRNMRKKYGV